jgi:C-terminal processing protease CtpA/Prc
MVGDVFDHDITIGTREERKKTEKIFGKGTKKFSGKIIVLIDSESASAAEMFARVVQLEKRGTVIGDQSAGAVMLSQRRSHRIGFGNSEKVSFDSAPTVYFGDSLTIANIAMADGKSLEHVGVTPDEVLLPTAQDLAAGRDPVLARAVVLAGGQMSTEEAGKLFPPKWIKYD